MPHSIKEDTPDQMIDENIILNRLNELRRWQEDQRMILAENQLDQQKMLHLEKQKLYELFGVSGMPDDSSPENQYDRSTISKQDSITANQFSDNSTSKHYDISSFDEKKLRLQTQSKQKIQNIVETFGNRSRSDEENHNYSQNVEIPRRSFLKRGEGLKSRFKISPDAFRLNNLPKYKFANKNTRHAQYDQKMNKKCHRQENTNDAKTVFKVGVTNEPGPPEGCLNNAINDTNQRCEFNIHKRAPDSGAQKYKQVERSYEFTPLSENQNGDSLENSTVSNQIGSSAFQPYLSTPVAKYLLDTPTRNHVQLQQDALNDLNYFEYLERNINQESKMQGDESDNDVVLQFKVGLSLSPNQYEHKENENDVGKQNKFANNHSFCDDLKHVRFTSSAVRIENEGQQPMEEIYTIPQVCSSNEKSMESFQRFKEKLFDRKLKRKFQNQLSLAKDFEVSDMRSNSSKCGDIDEEPEHVPAYLSAENECDFNKDKNELLQVRLQELDKEIQSFREQNEELTALIREHELIRLTFDQERRETNECLEKERINFNVYMHDERLELLNERTQWEKNMKDSRKLNRSEKDELVRLREKCLAHASESSSQEQKHIAAQGRIRSQLKNMEKEVKELRLEAENLRKDNKRLEKENIRLRRESSNKILNEINKSISKLAKTKESKGSDNENEMDDKNVCVKSGMKKCSNKNAHRTVVAKVTTHSEPLGETRLRSKSVPNLRNKTEEYSYEMLSDANIESSPNEMKLTSSYFSNDTEELKYVNIKSGIQSNVSNQKDDEKSTKRVIENADGSKDIWYSNGNLKKVSADGMCIRMLYFNKDIKETDIKEGTVKYYYSETNTWQTTYLDGVEILEYPNGQTEHRFKDGVVEIHFPNGSVRITNPERERSEGIKEEWRYSDGTNVIQLTNSDRILMLPNGQREVHTNGHKRREYPDGTVKIVYPDGSQETRYSNGRVRLKNKDGKLIMDSETISI